VGSVALGVNTCVARHHATERAAHPGVRGAQGPNGVQLRYGRENYGIGLSRGKGKVAGRWCLAHRRFPGVSRAVSQEGGSTSGCRPGRLVARTVDVATTGRAAGGSSSLVVVVDHAARSIHEREHRIVSPPSSSHRPAKWRSVALPRWLGRGVAARPQVASSQPGGRCGGSPAAPRSGCSTVCQEVVEAGESRGPTDEGGDRRTSPA